MGRMRAGLMIVLILVALVAATMATAQPAGSLDRYEGIQVACARCALGQTIGARLGALPAAPLATAVATTATREINLDDGRFEVSAVATVSPKRTGTGGAISYQVASNATGTARIWVDVGVLRYDGDTRGFAGASTSIPLGQTLTEYGRLGAGIMHDGTAMFYTRVAKQF